jgi:hypothetical protein
VWRAGCRDQGLSLGVWSSETTTRGLRLRAYRSGSSVQGLGFRIACFGMDFHRPVLAKGEGRRVKFLHSSDVIIDFGNSRAAVET